MLKGRPGECSCMVFTMVTYFLSGQTHLDVIKSYYFGGPATVIEIGMRGPRVSKIWTDKESQCEGA